MKKYRINPECLDNWGATDDTTFVSINEIKELAQEWGKAVEELMEQVTEED